jgi:ribokinase
VDTDAGRVTVVGSANVDYVLGLGRVPGPGETVPADSFSTATGGKGLNQAIAAARAGADTCFIGAVGGDEPGDRIRALVDDAGIDPHDLRRVGDAATGSAHIFLEHSGANRIAVVAGANGLLDMAWIEPRLRRHAAPVVLLQLETARSVVTECARWAAEHGVRVILTPAPLGDEGLSRPLLEAVAVLALNTIEAEAITGCHGRQATDALLELVPAVLLTRGSDGALYADRSGNRHAVAGLNVPVVDTTGAGDTFVGYFAAGLSRESSSAEAALTLANAAAAISVGRRGAVSGIPGRDELPDRP